MKTIHSGIEIEYREQDNRWYFELRGRSRSADSLSKAKEAIDKEPTPKRTQQFPKFTAYRFNYAGIHRVTVTSVAEGTSYRGSPSFWITNSEGGRSKEYASSLAPVNPHNDRLVNEIEALNKEQEAINEKIKVAKSNLEWAKVPAEITA